MDAGKLHEAIAKVCPITGVSIGNVNNKGTWRIDFDQAATQQQKDAAQAALAAFDVAAADAAEQAIKDRREAVTNAARADAVIDKLRTATLQEIVDYVNTNVTDLQSAKALMVKLAVGVAYAIRND